jgi:hypothetical protein
MEGRMRFPHLARLARSGAVIALRLAVALLLPALVALLAAWSQAGG